MLLGTESQRFCIRFKTYIDGILYLQKDGSLENHKNKMQESFFPNS